MSAFHDIMCFIESVEAEQQYDYKPFLRTYTIVPIDKDTYNVYADDFTSYDNTFAQVGKFILSGGDINELQ